MHCARELRPGSGTTVLSAVQAVLAQASSVVCYGAAEGLGELMQLGEVPLASALSGGTCAWTPASLSPPGLAVLQACV